MRCPNPECNRELIPGAKFCSYCRTPVTDTARKGSSGYKIWDPEINRMPHGISLGTGEQIVKKYEIGTYTWRSGSIDVIVTNKRVIRYEESTWFGMQSNQIDEINIDAVHGTSTSMMRSVSILGLFFTIVFLITGLSILFDNSPYGFINNLVGIIPLALAVFIALKSLRPTLLFCLHGAIGGPACLTVVNARGRLFGMNNTSVIFQFKPTKETTVMLKEIGACIYDLKTEGDKAISKWA